MTPADERFRHHDLGKCCACGGTENVRNIVMHNFCGPSPGKGWGCVVCHLASDRATSIICDACVANGTPIREVIDGFALEKKRVPIDILSKDLFDHDMRFHQDEVL